jgi:hypothetical protein
MARSRSGPARFVSMMQTMDEPAASRIARIHHLQAHFLRGDF